MLMYAIFLAMVVTHEKGGRATAAIRGHATKASQTAIDAVRHHRLDEAADLTETSRTD